MNQKKHSGGLTMFLIVLAVLIALASLPLIVPAVRSLLAIH